MVVSLSALRTDRLYSRKCSWYSFLLEAAFHLLADPFVLLFLPFIPSSFLPYFIFISLFLSSLSNDDFRCLDYTVSTIDEWIWSNGGMTLTGEKPTTWKETCPGATLHIIHSKCTDTGSNPGLLGERPATNRLRQGTANRSAICHSVLHPATHTFAHSSAPSVHPQPHAISRPSQLNTQCSQNRITQ
jgi:hypothetical protein